MFDSKYKEALENMKLSESFKAGLINKMKNSAKKPVPKGRLVLASVVGVLVLTTSVGLAANVATNGSLFRTMFAAMAPQTTGQGTVSTAPVPTVEPTIAVTPYCEPTATAAPTPSEAPVSPTPGATDAPEITPSVTPTEAPKATATPKPTATPVPSGRIAPSVSASAGSNCVVVSWAKITSPDLVGYKVVASKSCSTPKYSENGYYTWITNANTTSCTINCGASYNGGDVGKFAGGQAYYFSVTAVYGEEWQKVAGNAVQATMPGTAPAPTATPVPSARVAPSVNASAGDNCVVVSWAKITSPDLVGYKVVASKSCSTPKYSENGYYTWITDANTTSCTISNGEGYNGGDVGSFSGGQAYYFSVTAIYGEEWQKIAGNAVQVTMPGAPAPVATNPAVTITVTPAEGGVNVSWTPTTDATGFVYYKVVASVGTASPAYPDNGYYAYFEDPNCTSCFIATGSGYNGGDVGSFTSGVTYYFSITACYNDAKTPGNAVPATMP